MKLLGVIAALCLCLLMFGCGGSSSSGNMTVRTVNFARGANTINVTADTAILATGLAYGNATAYGSLSTFPQQISATDPTQGVTLGSLTLSASAGNFYTLYVLGVENGTPVSTLSLLQDTQPVASAVAANVRFGNFSTTITSNVDVYITSTSVGAPTGPVYFSNVAFGSVNAYITLPAGTYKVWITTTGTTAVQATSQVVLANGSDYSIYGDDTNSASANLVTITDAY